ncbi:hypothetical protein BDU57DRAFT_556329 [Ampelomyces quisqualis]|uniref:BTB domain-containing protein n=1 Tax=Ampelomyces quisqualis TaxID=50730 RepID=A0A6A5QMV6_AMPQU|nr:hypothetical protein BDU57DRAFT_556329 [Ampelomyces quisqualis]
MSRPDFVKINANDDKLEYTLVTPAPRTVNADIPLPKTPTKKPAVEATPTLSIEDATADFTIACNGGNIKAHKSILVASCPYFARMFRFDGKEATINKVSLEDVSRRILKYTLDFMYIGRYALPLGDNIPLTGFCNHARASFERDLLRARILKRKCAAAGKVLAPAHLLPHIHVYALADYFDMADLKAFARQGVKDVLHVYWNDKRIKLRNALDLAFSTTPDEDRGVRQPLIDILFAHPGLWVDDGDVRSWLEEHPDIFEEVDRDKGRDEYAVPADVL